MHHGDKGFPHARFYAFDIFADPDRGSGAPAEDASYFEGHRVTGEHSMAMNSLEAYGSLSKRCFMLPGYFQDTPNNALKAKMKAEKRRVGPKEFKGVQVPSGAYTIRAIKLGLTFGLRTDYENAVQIENSINCLNLDIYYLTQECECANAGFEYSRDVELQDEVFQAYNKVRDLERKLVREGIANPAIKMLVSEAGTQKDCVNRQTLATLNAISLKLEALVQ